MLKPGWATGFWPARCSASVGASSRSPAVKSIERKATQHRQDKQPVLLAEHLTVKPARMKTQDGMRTPEVMRPSDLDEQSPSVPIRSKVSCAVLVVACSEHSKPALTTPLHNDLLQLLQPMASVCLSRADKRQTRIATCVMLWLPHTPLPISSAATLSFRPFWLHSPRDCTCCSKRASSNCESVCQHFLCKI